MRNFFMTTLALFIVGCAVFVPGGRDGRMPMHIKKQSYSGKELRIDGFYYDSKFRSFYLYGNGVYLYNATGGFVGLPKIKETIINYRIKSQGYKDIVYWWGLFNINYPDIIIEGWMSGEGCSRYRTDTFHGKILNDTTVLFNDFPDTATFHFCSFIKADSTNRFIE